MAPSPSFPSLTVFTRSNGDCSSFLQEQVVPQQQRFESKDDNSVGEEEQDIDALIDQALTYKKLQEARETERSQLQVISKLHEKLQELLEENIELKTGAEELMLLSVEMRSTIDELTTEKARYKREAHLWKNKYVTCLQHLRNAGKVTSEDDDDTKVPDLVNAQEMLEQVRIKYQFSNPEVKQKKNISNCMGERPQIPSPDLCGSKDSSLCDSSASVLRGSTTAQNKSIPKTSSSFLNIETKKEICSSMEAKTNSSDSSRKKNEFSYSCPTISDTKPIDLLEKNKRRTSMALKGKTGILFLIGDDASAKAGAAPVKAKEIESRLRNSFLNNHHEDEQTVRTKDTQATSPNGSIATTLLSRTCCYVSSSEISNLLGKKIRGNLAKESSSEKSQEEARIKRRHRTEDSASPNAAQPRALTSLDQKLSEHQNSRRRSSNSSSVVVALPQSKKLGARSA